MRDKNTLNMIEGSLAPKILLFALPLMLSSILQLLFNAVDIIVVGKFAGDASLAAVSSTGSLVNLMVSLFIGLSVGTNVITAKYLGAHQEDKVENVVHTSIAIGVYFGAIMGVICSLLAKKFLILMDSPLDVIDLSALYLGIYFLGTPGNLVYNYGSALLRSKGDTKRPLYYLLVAGIVNLLLNLFTVIVLGMDVAGVAIATIASQYISAFLVVMALVKDEGALHLNIKELRIEKESFIEIIKVGLPCGLQSCLFSFSNALIQSSINSFGKEVMAGNGAASSIENFVYVSMNAFYQANQTFVGQNLGARKYERIVKSNIISLIYVTVVGLLLGYGVYYLAGDLLYIYTDSPSVVAAGISRMAIICKTYYLCGIMDVLCGGLRGVGYSLIPMISSLVGACGLRIIWIAYIFKAFPTTDTIYYSYPLSWIIVIIAHLFTFLAIKGKIQKQCVL